MIRSFLRPMDLVSSLFAQPPATLGPNTVDPAAVLGPAANYYIHPDVPPRLCPEPDGPFRNPDGQFGEVYRFAAKVAKLHQLQSVLDLGCGSGKKLLKYFPELTTTGWEHPATVARLQAKYPHRRWQAFNFGLSHPDPAQLVIACDVIEHLLNPDAMLTCIQRVNPTFAVIATPDRQQLPYAPHLAPPLNPTHVREWNRPEFHRYVSDFFDVVEHFPLPAAQCVLLRPKRT